METIRLFTAMPIGPDLRAVLSSFAKRLPSDRVRRIKSENLHITVHFIGEAPPERAKSAVDAVSRASAQLKSGSIPYRASAPIMFPPGRRPRMVVSPVVDSAGQLSQLWMALGTELRSSGFTVESRPYRPHITLAYIRKGAPAPDLDFSAGSPLGTELTADAVHVVRSTLAAGGSIHETVARIPL